MLREETRMIGAGEPNISPIQENLRNAFRRFFYDSQTQESEIVGSYPVDIWARNNAIIVEAELPGYRMDEIKLHIEYDVIRISAARTPQETENRLYLKERCTNRIERALKLPTSVDPSHMEVRFENGVLRLELPRKKEKIE